MELFPPYPNYAHAAGHRGARFLHVHAAQCPSEHPAGECPELIEVLRRRLFGETHERLTAG